MPERALKMRSSSSGKAMPQTEHAHRDVLELLPWYVNGSLGGKETRALEQHLSSCLPCNAALREERRLQSLVSSTEAVPQGPEYGLRSLMHQIDRAERGSRRASRLRGFPVLGYGLAAALGGAVVWVLIAIGQRDIAPADYRTLSDAVAPAAPTIDVVFSQPPAPAELDGLLAELDAVLVAGPSDIGRYTLALGPLTDSELDALLARLNADPRLRFAGRSFGAAPRRDGANP